MIEKKAVVGDLEISYMRKPARYDTKHLVVVFSGFSGNGKPTYNHSNTLTLCPAEVVWIKDFFFGGETYYLCAKGKFNIEEGVHNFILGILDELGLGLADCTLLGGSKGGSAAMYYGFKYNYGTIVAAVPQFHIGSYVKAHHPYAFRHMVEGLSDEEVSKTLSKLDTVVADAARVSRTQKNVYLITSLADVQYETEIINNVDRLRKFSNFNVIMANSDLIRQHNQVVLHTLPISISIVNLSAMGMSPSFSEEDVKFKDLRHPVAPSLVPFVKLKKFRVAEGRIYPEGVAIIRGVSCEGYSDIDLRLIFNGGGTADPIKLAKGNNPSLTRELFDGDLVVYDKGWFCTLKYSGILIDDLPLGEWSLDIAIAAKGVQRQASIIADKHAIYSGEGRVKKMVFSTGESGTVLSVTLKESTV